MRKIGCLFSISVMILLPVFLILASHSFLIDKRNYLKVVNDEEEYLTFETQEITNQAQLMMGEETILYSDTPTLILENQTNPFKKKKVVIKKVDQESRLLLKDAVFEVENEQREVIQSNLKIPKNGELIIRLEAGKYFLIEKHAPKGYRLLNKPIPFTVR